MNIFNERLFFFFLMIGATFLQAQNDGNATYSVEFDFGLSRTLHYHRPISVTQCYEACIPLEQKARKAYNANLSIYRNLSASNSIKLGLGWSEYRFWERGKASPGDTSLLPYETTRAISYYDISVGYRHTFKKMAHLYPFVETEMMLELPVDRSFAVNPYGIANKTRVGLLVPASGKWDVVFDAFYKTGIINYSSLSFTDAYIPYGYGIQIGLNRSI